MIEAPSPAARADVDIAADIDAIILRYPPLVHDRRHLRIDVQNGQATITGHVRSLNTRDYLLQTLGAIRGLESVNTDYLHVDEQVRISLGAVVPVGIVANVEYGTVVLSGRLPDGLTIDELVERVGMVPGVRRVVIALRD